MVLNITRLFQGNGTKRLVISYKEGSDFDLVLQQLQLERQADKKNVSELIRTLILATHGCEVLIDHPEVNEKQYRRFCLQALGVISGYREIVQGYLGFIVAKDTESELAPTQSNKPQIKEPTKKSSNDNLSRKDSYKEGLSLINSLLPK